MKSHNAAMHYSFTVKDLKSTRRFYIDLLGCQEGRSTDTWVDFDFFGNQLSAHVSKKKIDLDYCGFIDGISVPLPHFGAIRCTHLFQRIYSIHIWPKVSLIYFETVDIESNSNHLKYQ